MPGRRGRGALGLRVKIVGAVLATTVATLGVAALALLGPLEQSLRHAELRTLRSDLNRKTMRGVANLHLDQVRLSTPDRLAVNARLLQLSARIGGSVTVHGYPSSGGAVSQPVAPARAGAEGDGAFEDVARAFATHRTRYTYASLDGRPFVRAAIPFVSGELWYVLAVRKPIDEITEAVTVVRNAFITAALAGLGLTLILGIPLSATLVRRLRRLREAALELAQDGPAVEVPVDRARDEVGDLARTLAAMQQRLQLQEEARRAFVATASHELRTPLTSLEGMLELLHDDLRYDQPDLDDARDLLDRARAQSRRLGRLAADLLDLSRLDAQVQLRSEPVELGELSRAVLAEFELATAERGITTRLDDLGAPVWALADPGSTARILRILLDNAVRISPEHSELRIELRSEPEVSLSVCDEGPGVLQADREQIFRRFERGRDTAGQAGFGLGLAIGRELAERMGGRLTLEESPGPGATFKLRLPGLPTATRTLSRSAS